jgi:hypothetical protein
VKQCVRCKQVKRRNEFYARGDQIDGLDYYCIPCKKEVGREYRKRRPEVGRANARKWREENKERADERARVWRKANPGRSKEICRGGHWRRRYGLSIEQFNALVLASGGKCNICGEATKNLVIDHCHKTGKVREMLCIQCNVAIERLDTVPGFIEKAAAYLEKHNE